MMSKSFSQKIAPTGDGSTYNFSTLGWCGSDTHSVETLPGVVSLDLFLG